ncbi:6-phosphogluconate dehydrogenase 2 [Colletotrichum karsti]|uniref:6-phosphogluconate dehydrogenase 2 n=1 Tax=Colletotrichum karsti TaxID=1095194 RepID=A0A9P6LMD4_9PEZI|nr:6-phosphogluconate dehydrogenase 2 [Colletotrichum karsti]KAF9881384.1 6-phosphogluconate dehydrogenase 2 [Colletotrichum karsti]
MAPRLLWIGLGNIGRGMCQNLVEKAGLDKPLLIHNRTLKRATDLGQSLPQGKTEVVESLADAIGQADIIFSCIADDQAVEEVFATAIKGDVKGKVFVECSTIAPETTEAAALSVLERGAEFICAPIFGAPAMVAAGNATLVLAGPKASIDKIRPYIDAVAAREINMADEPYRKASILKVLGNTVILGMVEQLAETYVTAEKSGLGTGYLKQFVEAMFGGSPYPAYTNRMLQGDYYKREEPLFAVDLARKDARHAMAIAKTAGTRLHNIETADKHLQIVKDHAGPSGDMAGIYGAVRKEAGLDFENDSYSIFVGLVIVAAMAAGAWFLSPKGENQIIWRSSLLLALACCYLMWAITFLAQLNPLIEPRRSDIRPGFEHH